jgi:hypothetical protein
MRLVPPPQHRLLRTRQAAEYLCMSEWKLRRLIQDGLLPYLHGGEGAPFLLDICGGPGCSDSFRRFLSGRSVFRFRLPEILAGS